ncbi:hypothetical protein [Microbacterium sp. NIBRBAC000506063]|uniref:hypothetical protein n=1 Tax=Microbacterium sp. NIBRBAC000506063 TaxID=2734618 RepID=UPI001CB6F598|nr:hypothetical protein [Microbacterium sp. NIBRBAC000506063]
MSITQMSARRGRRGRMAAVRPMTSPPLMSIAVAPAVSSREVRVAIMTRAKMSRPRSSVPKRYSAPAVAQRSGMLRRVAASSQTLGAMTEMVASTTRPTIAVMPVTLIHRERRRGREDGGPTRGASSVPGAAVAIIVALTLLRSWCGDRS